jgi:chorismate synthase
MKSTFGKNLTLSLFGESHGTAIGIVIDGLAPGIELDMEHIKKQMNFRRAVGELSTARQEADEIKIVSGFFNGHTTGTPLTIIIENKSTRSKDYEKTKNLLRPGHADYTAFMKYDGWQDYRGGGHFSGRLTAPIVAAGAICLQILSAHGITIGTHLAKCAGIADSALPTNRAELVQALDKLNNKAFAVLDDAKGEEMQQAILAAKMNLDSVGGILETAICNIPAGIGEPFFNSVESVLAHLMFSVPAVKGIEFGAGFAFADMCGSEANDPLRIEDGEIYTTSNNNGGINGGISNGMPIIFRTVIKPTASIYKEQQTVDFADKTNADLQIQGRHDPAIIHRARVVVDSMAAIGLVELFCEAYGTNWQTSLLNVK